MSEHLRPHFDERGTCDCDCDECTIRDGEGDTVCICPDCDQAWCGLHATVNP